MWAPAAAPAWTEPADRPAPPDCSPAPDGSPAPAGATPTGATRPGRAAASTRPPAPGRAGSQRRGATAGRGGRRGSTASPDFMAPGENLGPGTIAAARVGQRVRVPKTAELVAAHLRRQIVRGELHEGDALPPEAVLMEQFGV
ncbi:GntR family transcriptional regulator, partial [Frankia gtarii]|uniref:GntR family transcriptional regulator n=1 Tax=Frankia gtarii TaxID=2950102 RepID=UPI0021C102C8